MQPNVWRVPARRDRSFLDDTHARFLQSTRDIGRVGWDNPCIPKLWRYNLHYFDDLNAAGTSLRTDLQKTWVERWINGNPPARGTGWDPYPTSIRIVNWIKWAFGGVPLDACANQSLAVQVRHLTRRIEWHLMGNHLLCNAKALIFAGTYFSGSEAERWRETGIRILAKQLDEQVLADGGHFELSPMYHALFCEDLLDLLNLCIAADDRVNGLQQLRTRLAVIIPRTIFWLRALSHPDGTLGLFNDCAEGVAPQLDEIVSYASRLGVVSDGELQRPCVFLNHSGYVRLSRGPAVALIDTAAVGPDYLPGHAHADTLSFELSLHGRKLIVNGGTSRYEVGNVRSRERSTSQHSTLELDGLDSSEVWSAFRVGRRAYPFDRRVETSQVICSHDGYSYLRGRPIHTRTWRLTECALKVIDHVSVKRYAARARFLLAPGLTINGKIDRFCIVDNVGQAVACVRIHCGYAKVETTTYAQRFGEVQEIAVLIVELTGGQAISEWNWCG
ncbi:MAG: alginate lyase family protein [Steroidobacteraceae bacterium]